ncbi:hypothetical protein [Sulfitobacter mediterraneus]|uniref:Phospholipase D-like protein n=1 Tax=Sulfitobacter mediterraneus TaxID=83219 RepID=A0A2T6CB61_9RHOB|nr:hypothetical protein [Sulfitobacter mediterraneus]PTX72446.1 hypothetical protein C8N31_111161 [Sulfitobacter mediterraneus]
MEDIVSLVLTLLLTVFVVYLVLWFCILLPASMAKRRGRSQVIRVLVSVLITPFLAIFLLWAFGDAKA